MSIEAALSIAIAAIGAAAWIAWQTNGALDWLIHGAGWTTAIAGLCLSIRTWTAQAAFERVRPLLRAGTESTAGAALAPDMAGAEFVPILVFSGLVLVATPTLARLVKDNLDERRR